MAAAAPVVPSGDPPIITAAQNGDVAIVQKLLAAGTNANTLDSTGHTPLDWAAYRGHLAVVKFLVEHKADINAHGDSKATTPLMHAADTGHGEVAAYLIDKGADVRAVDNDGNSALTWAAKMRSVSTIQLLLSRGADGPNALLVHANGGDAIAVRLLVENGVSANASAVDQPKCPNFCPTGTALTNATQLDHLDVMTLLLTLGADVNLAEPTRSNYETPLMWAAARCNLASIQLLLDKGAKRSPTNQKGETAYDLARTGFTSSMQPCSTEVLAALQ